MEYTKEEYTTAKAALACILDHHLGKVREDLLRVLEPLIIEHSIMKKEKGCKHG